MANATDQTATYESAYGNYSYDMSNGYNLQPMQDTSIGKYLQSIGKNNNWFNQNWYRLIDSTGYNNWVNQVNSAYQTYADNYNNRWNSIQNTLDQYEEAGYNPYYMDSLNASGTGSASVSPNMVQPSPEKNPLTTLATSFGQLVGMIQAFQGLRAQQIDIQNKEIEQQYLPKFLENRNNLSGLKGINQTYMNQYLPELLQLRNEGKSLSNSRLGIAFSTDALNYDFQRWLYGKPDAQELGEFDYSGSLMASPYIAHKKANDLFMKYADIERQWEHMSKQLSYKYDENEMKNLEKIFENYSKGLNAEGVELDLVQKNLDWQLKSFAVDKGLDYLSKLLGVAGSAVGLKRSFFDMGMSRRKQQYYENYNNLKTFGVYNL